MNKPALFAFAAQFAPRLFQVRRRTWIGLGVGLLVLFGLLIWAAFALIGWIFGQAQGWMGAAPESVRGVIEQAEQVVPDARAKLGELVPALKPAPPARDVSGADLGPVARYPGLARTYWHQEGKQITIEYEGKAGYAAVLDHYVKEFATLGYAQNVRAATPSAETHEYTKDGKRIALTITQLPNDVVRVHVEMLAPE